MVEIEMPQGADVRGFVAADLSRRAPFFRHDLTRASDGPKLRAACPAVSLHEVLDRGIRGEPPQ